jgi:hypothetical protein
MLVISAAGDPFAVILRGTTATMMRWHGRRSADAATDKQKLAVAAIG